MEMIKIPKRFQENLKKKFNVNNFTKPSKSTLFTNICDCLLCLEYKSELDCSKCPFRRLGDGLNAGCTNFLEMVKQILDIECLILLTQQAVFTDDLTSLGKIVKYAAEHIEFVENRNGNN